MAQQINVNIRMDKEVKEQADALFNELGFNLTTAVNAFVRQSLRDRAIPFQIEAKSAVPKQSRISLVEAFKAAQEQSIINGTDTISSDDIDAEIASYRQEKRSNP